MSSLSNNNGRAYEYACVLQLKEKLRDKRILKVHVVENSSLEASKQAWENSHDELQKNHLLSADAAVDTLFETEPNLLDDADDILEIKIQSDAEGVVGDVRDILIRKKTPWEIGLSLKHNHFAVKHSRLAKNLDFGKKWFEIPCSCQYWCDIKPIFDHLEKEKNKCKNWSDLPEKEESVYIPLLTAFLNEINRSYADNKNLPTKMVEYLLGRYDFYKIISLDSKRVTQIQPYNLRGTLNKSSPIEKPKIIIPIAALPTRIVKAEFKPASKNTVEIYFDEGWQFSFRIHNASTKVETSLKFDVQIVGAPTTIIVLESKWIGARTLYSKQPV